MKNPDPISPLSLATNALSIGLPARGNYTLRFSSGIRGQKTFHTIEKDIIVKGEPVLVGEIQIPFHTRAQMINTGGRDGIKFTSLSSWRYTDDSNEAALYKDGIRLYTPGIKGIKEFSLANYLVEHGDPDYPNLVGNVVHSYPYALRGVKYIPSDGYQNEITLPQKGGTKYIFFKTEQGYYGKRHIEAAQSSSGVTHSISLQWVLTSNDEEFHF